MPEECMKRETSFSVNGPGSKDGVGHINGYLVHSFLIQPHQPPPTARAQQAHFPSSLLAALSVQSSALGTLGCLLSLGSHMQRGASPAVILPGTRCDICSLLGCALEHRIHEGWSLWAINSC